MLKQVQKLLYYIVLQKLDYNLNLEEFQSKNNSLQSLPSPGSRFPMNPFYPCYADQILQQACELLPADNLVERIYNNRTEKEKKSTCMQNFCTMVSKNQDIQSAYKVTTLIKFIIWHKGRESPSKSQIHILNM